MRILTAYERVAIWHTAEQEPLPDMPEPGPSRPSRTLYRGLRWNPSDPGLEGLDFDIYGRPNNDMGDLFGRPIMRGPDAPRKDPGFPSEENTRRLIEWLDQPGETKYHHNLPGWIGETEDVHFKPRGRGLGPHWTSDIEVARDAATLYPNAPGIVLETEWPEGVRRDPHTDNLEQEYPGEAEVRLFPGAPTPITRVHHWSPKLNQWHTQEFGEPLQYTSHRQSATMYHLTDNPDFTPDPEYRPQEGLFWTQDPATASPGLYVTNTPNYWTGWGNRPYAAEFDVPDEVVRRNTNLGRPYPEHLIPPEDFDKMKLLRVVPFAGLGREDSQKAGHFSDPEWAMGQDFETGDKFRTRRDPNGHLYPEDRDAMRSLWKKNYGDGPYRYPADAREWTPQQRRKYEKWYTKYHTENYPPEDY